MYFLKHLSIILIILYGTIFESCAQKLSDKKHNLNIALAEFKNDNDLKNAGLSFYAIDLKTGEVLASLNPDLALAPASTQKLLTTATALEILGANFRFKTQLEIVGDIDTLKSELNGFIIIKGGGDPTLGSKYFTYGSNNKFMNNWAEALKKKGISKVNGRIIGDARIFGQDIVPPTWSWEDIGNYFGAGANGLTIFDNIYTLTFKTGINVGDSCKITSITPQIDNLVLDNSVRADNIHSDNSYIFGAPYSYFRYIRGELPKGKKDYKVKGSMPDPAFFAASEFSKKLNLYGITFSEKETTFRLSPELTKIDSLKHEVIYETLSPKLSSIIKETNYRSVNLFAEHCLCQIGLKGNNNPKTKNAARYLTEYWQKRGMNTKGLSVNDGSGLSRYNTITAKQMVFMLKYMKNQSRNYETFYNTIPVAGVSGTVKSLCKNSFAENNMRVKSGSIRVVAAYAGYVTTKSGREIAFFIDMNNYNCSSYSARKKLEKVLIALAEFEL